MVIGHELTHAFDSIGYKLNEKGEAKPWWSSISTQRFDQSAQCFKDEYSTFSAPFKDPAKRAAAPNGGAINGERTLSENIADNGGLNIAYEAWVSFENDLNGELRKTVLQDYNGLTDEQVFFVSFAQTWCSVQEDDQMSFVVSWVRS